VPGNVRVPEESAYEGLFVVPDVIGIHGKWEGQVANLKRLGTRVLDSDRPQERIALRLKARVELHDVKALT
jgi:hypothetical protein